MMRGGSGGGAPAYNPVTALFGAGEKGLLYDLSNMASIFQDVGGSTPITTPGQTIARINDLSGNGNHATQATAARRMLFQQAGGTSFMSLDGVDDELWTSAAVALGGTDVLTLCIGVRKLNNASGMICESYPDILGATGSYFLFSGTGSLGTGYTSPSRGGAAYVSGQGAFSAAGGADTSVIFSTHSISGDLSTIRKNGIGGADGTVDKGVGAFTDTVLSIGGRGAGGLKFFGYIYSMAIVARVLTSTERGLLEAWTASKSGVTL